jgi:dienelactone hydrolase
MSPTTWNYDDAGKALVGELYRPEGTGNGLAVLVIHEADGIGGNVRRHCARLAELGYVAAAADMHGDGRVLDADEIPGALETFKSDPSLFRRRVRAALDALVSETSLPPASIAAIGFCFGGMAVLELARSGAPLAAVASFHGILTTKAPATPGAVSARILACTGALDPLVPPEQLAEFQAEMTAAGADWHLLVHGRALHSYTNVDVDKLGDPRMAYDAAAARQSWSALLTFLEETFAR